MLKIISSEERLWLLDDYLGKWEFASKFSGTYVSSFDFVGDDFRGNVPYDMNYLVVDEEKYIPLVAKPSGGKGYTITVPKDALEYLKSVEWSLGTKYLQGDEGFLIFRRRLGDARLIVPIKAEDDGRIAVVEWFEKLLRAMLSEAGSSEYLDEEGNVIWKSLKKFGVLLKFEVVEPTNGKSVEKIFAITDPNGESIRIRAGEGLANKLLVLRNFEFLKASWLVEKLKKMGFSEKTRNRFMKIYGSVMALKEDEPYKLVGTKGGTNDACGRIGEAKTTLFIAEKKWGSYILELRYEFRIGNERVELDIVTINELIDTKYWSEETFRMNVVDASETLFNYNVINRLKKYELAMSKLGKKKVYLVFVKEISEELFKLGEERIRSTLGGDTGWLRIINGLNNLNLEG